MNIWCLPIPPYVFVPCDGLLVGPCKMEAWLRQTSLFEHITFSEGLMGWFFCMVSENVAFFSQKPSWLFAQSSLCPYLWFVFLNLTVLWTRLIPRNYNSPEDHVYWRPVRITGLCTDVFSHLFDRAGIDLEKKQSSYTCTLFNIYGLWTECVGSFMLIVYDERVFLASPNECNDFLWSQMMSLRPQGFFLAIYSRVM